MENIETLGETEWFLGKAELAKMAFEDIAVGPKIPAPKDEIRQNRLFTNAHDYSHALPPHLRDKYELKVFHHGPERTSSSWGASSQNEIVSAQLFEKMYGSHPLYIGDADGYIHKDNPTELRIMSQSLDPRHYNKRLGRSALNALIAHAHNVLGIRQVSGGLHSSMARRSHESVAKEHALDLPPPKRSSIAESVEPRYKEYDAHYGDYQYSTVPKVNKSEPGTGYNISHDAESFKVPVEDLDETVHHLHIQAHLPGQGQVGTCSMVYHPATKSLVADWIHIDPNHRRQGLGSKMYQYAEAVSGGKVAPNDIQTELGQKFHAQKDPLFGKTEDELFATPLNKMAFEDIKVGPKVPPNHYVDPEDPSPVNIFDYSHVLNPQHQKDFKIHVRAEGNVIEAGLINKQGYMVGSHAAELFPDSNNVHIYGQNLDRNHRGKGLGAAMLNALIAHAHNVHGARNVSGNTHSSMARRTHESVARTHNLDLPPPEKSTQTKNREEAYGHEVQPDYVPNDSFYGPYEYSTVPKTKKTEDLEKVTPVDTLETIPKEDDPDVVWKKSPFPYQRKPVVPSRLEAGARVETIPLKGLYGSQTSVTAHGVQHYLTSKTKADLPLVYREPNGVMTIGDGHHRLAAAVLRGENKANVRLVRIAG
jgi:GNAT superfamily N-acetyltransferase